MIKKRGSKQCVISHRTGRNMGCYPTKAGAKRRLRQVKAYSKNKNG